MKYLLQQKRILIILLILIIVSFGFKNFFNEKTEAPIELIELTLEELKQYNGQNGQPTYVAVDGMIYDLSKCNKWKSGVHEPSLGKAMAGRDLTAVLRNTPHGAGKLKRYPVVGKIIEKLKTETDK
ncbi:MAG: hypothetical protein KC733_01170 [Candidatus Omnitrophica bacterium]|nr:hypothetical protein [Candidatus Omnitrophota bacterium]